MPAFMLQTVRLLTLVTVILTVCFFFFRYKQIKENFLFFIFCLHLFLVEGLMFLTAQLGIKNHVLANIDTLVYSSILVFLICRIWESFVNRKEGLKVLKITTFILILIGWVVENFIIESITIYNSLLSCIISFLMVILSVYLINMILFLKNGSIFKDSNGLLLIGILIRSFSTGLILLFLNYRMNFSDDFYAKILVLVNVALIVSNIFFLLGVICLPKNRKYTWPF
jgi:hypothetical protein